MIGYEIDTPIWLARSERAPFGPIPQKNTPQFEEHSNAVAKQHKPIGLVGLCGLATVPLPVFI